MGSACLSKYHEKGSRNVIFRPWIVAEPGALTSPRGAESENRPANSAPPPNPVVSSAGRVQISHSSSLPQPAASPTESGLCAACTDLDSSSSSFIGSCRPCCSSDLGFYIYQLTSLSADFKKHIADLQIDHAHFLVEVFAPDNLETSLSSWSTNSFSLAIEAPDEVLDVSAASFLGWTREWTEDAQYVYLVSLVGHKNCCRASLAGTALLDDPNGSFKDESSDEEDEGLLSQDSGSTDQNAVVLLRNRIPRKITSRKSGGTCLAHGIRLKMWIPGRNTVKPDALAFLRCFGPDRIPETVLEKGILDGEIRRMKSKNVAPQTVQGGVTASSSSSCSAAAVASVQPRPAKQAPVTITRGSPDPCGKFDIGIRANDFNRLSESFLRGYDRTSYPFLAMRVHLRDSQSDSVETLAVWESDRAVVNAENEVVFRNAAGYFGVKDPWGPPGSGKRVLEILVQLVGYESKTVVSTGTILLRSIIAPVMQWMARNPRPSDDPDVVVMNDCQNRQFPLHLPGSTGKDVMGGVQLFGPTSVDRLLARVLTNCGGHPTVEVSRALAAAKVGLSDSRRVIGSNPSAGSFDIGIFIGGISSLKCGPTPFASIRAVFHGAFNAWWRSDKIAPKRKAEFMFSSVTFVGNYCPWCRAAKLYVEFLRHDVRSDDGKALMRSQSKSLVDWRGRRLVLPLYPVNGNGDPVAGPVSGKVTVAVFLPSQKASLVKYMMECMTKRAAEYRG